MKLSWRWLAELVDLSGISPEQAAATLCDRVVEVERLEAVGTRGDGVVVAKTLDVRPHPGADRLRLVRVDGGDGDTPEIVCGAPNVAVGQWVAWATVGASLPGGQSGAPVVVAARPVRGIESRGMLCSEAELGLSTRGEGILVLEGPLRPGMALGEALPLDDVLFDIANVAITNRPDLWGHIGFARELGAALERPLLAAPALPQPDPAAVLRTPFAVEIVDRAGCARYIALELAGLENGPSPLATRLRLERLGLRAIDRLVDLTHLVMLELGQPLHAFDRDRLEGRRIEVRRAREGESFRALDGSEHTLADDDLAIADESGPIALAGVMGARASGVGPTTKALLLEAATFDPARVRRTAARYDMRGEASRRFEKGLDVEAPLAAALRFGALLRAQQPNVVREAPLVDRRVSEATTRRIVLPMTLVRRRLGIRVPEMAQRAALQALGFGVREVGSDLEIEVPSWRAGRDVRGAEDLVEEIGRIHGYDRIAPMAPVASMRVHKPDEARLLDRQIAVLLALDLGFHEVTNRSHLARAELDLVGLEPTSHAVLAGVEDPADRHLAQTTLPRLLALARANRVESPAAAIFESTRLFATWDPTSGHEPVEVRTVGLLAWGPDASGATPSVVLHLATDVRRLLARLGAVRASIVNGQAPALAPGLPPPRALHPGRAGSIAVAGRVVGWLGEVAPHVVRAAGLVGRPAAAELNLDALLEALAAEPRPPFEPPLRYPVVPFDVSIFVPRATRVDEVASVIAAAIPGRVRAIACFDVYEGQGVPAGQASLAFRCELFDRERTLDAAAAERLRAAIVAALAERNWTVRGPAA